MEKSRSVYRFLLPVEAGKSKTLAVVEERLVDQTVYATSLPSDTVALFLKSSAVSPAVKDALQKLVALKARAAEAQAARARVETQMQDIYREQARIRENITRVDKGSTLYNRYVKTLSDQEDQLASLTDALGKARAEEAARQKDVDTFLLNLEVK
jgi:chromosome segregation ATPase